MRILIRSIGLGLLATAIAQAGCGSGGNGTGSTGGVSHGGGSAGAGGASNGGSSGSSGSAPSQTGLAAALEQCHLLGSFRITGASDNACDDFPQLGEPVTIAAESGGPVLRAGTLQLPIASAGDNCTFVARGCQTTAATGDTGARYLSAEITISKNSGGVHLDARATDVLGGRVGPCASTGDTPVSFDGQAAGGCQPAGNYLAANPGVLASGSCQISWDAGDVTITAADDGTFDLDWAGTTIDGLKLDQASCSLSGSEGLSSASSFDTWSWNGVLRHLQLQLTVSASGLSGQATDSLDKATSKGIACPGGTYDLQAAILAARPVVAFAPTCSGPRPSACGDGVCDPGESCTCRQDCPCQAGTECAPDGTCRSTCTLASEATACGTGQRCTDDSTSSSINFFPSDKMHCDPQGTLGVGEVCTKTNDCQAGLICHSHDILTPFACTSPCGSGLPACPAGATCSPPGDAGAGSRGAAVEGCELPAGPGEACNSVKQCTTGYSCYTLTRATGASSTFCSKDCSTNQNCSAPISTCDFIGICVAP